MNILAAQHSYEHTSSWHSDYLLAKEHESSCDDSTQPQAAIHRRGRQFHPPRFLAGWPTFPPNRLATGGGIIAATSGLSTVLQTNFSQSLRLIQIFATLDGTDIYNVR